MDQYLYKYLVLHKHLNIPQLGNFAIQNTPARYDAGSGLLHSPKPVILFTAGEVAVSEKTFFEFLGNEMGVDDLTAIKLFHDFSYRFRNDLQEKGSVELKGVGVLTKHEDKISFQPAHDLAELLPTVKPGAGGTLITEEESVTEDADTVEKKDQWWVYALVLFILAGGALIVYYI
ncbi:MAG: hypothetical protein ABI581_17915 [Sediminibacterium sp.]